MKKWERKLAVAGLVVGVVGMIIGLVGIIVTCVSIEQTATAGTECVEPVNQIIILGDVIVADTEVAKNESL